ncbi:nucleotide exchange factor GrpE [Metamycoplasma sualvi]|uniref:nucleotide exchange factor GrpE n=1 Tax=Metamycoplasma sualvi TaxID=2125 RepID=UPI00387369EF
MNNVDNKWIIELNDILIFNLIIERVEDRKKFKKDNITITLGKDEILADFDQKLIGIDLSTDKLFKISVNLDTKTTILDRNIEKGEYELIFDVIKLQKNSTKEILETSTNEEERTEKQEIKSLKKENEKLLDKITKLEQEKELHMITYKAKAEEMAKNAAEKVEKLKNEIKEKAKEDIEHKSKFATQKLLEEILNPINNLYLAVSSGSNSDNPAINAYVKGFQMLVDQIFSILENNGINIIEPKVKDIFDPELHFAQEIIEEAGYQKDEIIKVISRGYKLHERIIKPAVVIVAK